MNNRLLTVFGLGIVLAFTVDWMGEARGQGQPRQPWTSSKVRGAPTPPDPYRIELAFPHLRFDNPKSLAEIPGANRMIVAHHGGHLVSFTKDTTVDSTSMVVDLSQWLDGAVSIHSVEFHPDFLSNHYLFLCYRHGSAQKVARITLRDEPEPTAVPGSLVELIDWAEGGHSGGCLQFGPDGYLYVSTGDASGPTPPDALTTGQDISDLLGAVLRIDVNRKSDRGNYAVPDDNPFVGLPDARPEIWSYGLRNPWKFGIDRETGDIFVADNGWETWEMIHRIHRGSNCGWPIMEGRARLRTEVEPGPTPITPPIKDHPHTEANSVIGGPVYRGQQLSELNGTFVYGDYITGTIWGLRAGRSETGDRQDEFDHRTLVDTDLHIVAFTEGSDGELFVLDYDTTGQIYKVVKSDAIDTSASFPRRLSETGLFASTPDRMPNAGVIPYSVVSSQWADGAQATRFVAIPGRGSIELSAVEFGESEFPNGTVLVKHLSLPAKGQHREVPLETQLLHFENGVWNPYSYLWDEDGQNASLVDARGTDRMIAYPNDPRLNQTWHVGSVNECRLCHNAAAGVVLGFTARQLNRKVQGGDDDQWMQMARQRVITRQPSLEVGSAKFVDPHDTSASLDDRARSYLHTNCGMCHQRQGPSTVSFYAHRDYPFDQLRITKQPGIGTFGIKSPRLVAAGDPYRSVILYRMSKLGNGRMPYIGTRLIDERGVALIESWIRSLPGDSSDTARSMAALIDPSQEPNAAQIDQWLETTDGALYLASRMHQNQASDDLRRHVLDAIGRMDSYRRGLFEHFLPESERRKTLGPNPDLEMVLRLEGERTRGELIFLSDAARCRVCHDTTDPNRSTGPTLGEIRGKYKQQRSELLKHIIEPSLQMDEKFTPWTVITTDGKLHSGLLIARDSETVRLRMTDGTTMEVDQDDVEVMKKGDRSIMPDGAVSDLTPQEAADLVAFLMGEETVQ